MLSRPPTSSRDLCRAALRETLERKGMLDRVKAQIRAEVFHSMDAEARRATRCARVRKVRLIPSTTPARRAMLTHCSRTSTCC